MSRTPRAALWVPLLFFLCVWGMSTRGKFSASGDEPHYLIIAESLVADGDLDLENNYANGANRRFGPHVGDPDHAARTKTGAFWSIHDVGLPIVLLPAYAVLTRGATLAPVDVLARFRMTHGQFAYALLGLVLTALVALGLSLLVRAFARESDARTAAWVVAIVAFSPPVIAHALLVFPETLAFVAVCGVVWLSCLREDELTVRRVALVFAAVGYLPLLHRKYALFMFGLLLVILVSRRSWFRRQRSRTLAGLGVIAVLPLIAIHLLMIVSWGSIGGPHALNGWPFSMAGLPTGGLGLLFDRERGLFSYAPVYLIAPAAFALSWRRSWPLVVPIALLYVPASAFVFWHAGFSPAARFLLPLTPLVALAVVRAASSQVIRLVSAPLVVVQAAILITVVTHPRVLWPKGMATNPALERIPVVGPAYQAALPSIMTGDSLSGAWVWVGVVVVLTLAIVMWTRRFGSDRNAP